MTSRVFITMTLLWRHLYFYITTQMTSPVFVTIIFLHDLYCRTFFLSNHVFVGMILFKLLFPFLSQKIGFFVAFVLKNPATADAFLIFQWCSLCWCCFCCCCCCYCCCCCVDSQKTNERYRHTKFILSEKKVSSKNILRSFFENLTGNCFLQKRYKDIVRYIRS